MKKVCDGCGGTKFTVEIREYDSYARSPNQSNITTEVKYIECTSCRKQFSF